MTDVAKEAKVSVMTVSRVLNKKGYVKEETREAVEKAIRELDYRPNLVAKSLVTGKSNIIAYVLSDISDQFYGSVCKGVENACFNRGYTAIICNVDENNSVDNYIDMIIDRKLDGVIFHHLPISEEQIQVLESHMIQCITIDNEIDLKNTSSLDGDDYQGARKAVSYLVKQGYKKISCIRGEDTGLAEEKKCFLERSQHKIWQQRTKGYLDELENCCLEPGKIYMGRGSASTDVGFECGRQIAKEILADKERPEAIYCGNDILALGVLSELLEMKLDIPDYMAVVGHDGLEMCRMLYPRVTTVVQPRYELGVMGADMLIDRISGKKTLEHKILESSLFIGDTTR